MKKIKFNNVEYSVPTKWEEVTLAMQIKVSDVAAQQQYVKTLGIIAGYTGISVDELKISPVHSLTKVMKQLEFLQTDIPNEPIYNFTFNGHNYHVTDNILEQEFQDFVAIQTAIGEHKENIWKLTPYLLAVMAKREGETLDDYDINKRAEEFKQLDVVTANRVSAFFLSNTKALNFVMTLSSPEVIEGILRNKNQELQDSLNKLRKQRGGNLLIRLWIMTSRKYIKFLNKNWEKFYNSPASNNSKKNWMQTCKSWLYRKRKTNLN